MSIYHWRWFLLTLKPNTQRHLQPANGNDHHITGAMDETLCSHLTKSFIEALHHIKKNPLFRKQLVEPQHFHHVHLKTTKMLDEDET